MLELARSLEDNLEIYGADAAGDVALVEAIAGQLTGLSFESAEAVLSHVGRLLRARAIVGPVAPSPARQ